MVSYRKSHIKKRVKSLKEKKPILKRRWFWVLILGLFITAALIYFLFFFEPFQISNIIILGAEKISSDKLGQSVERGIGLKSIFFADTHKIESQVLEEFPTVEKVLVKRKLPGAIVVDITERAPIGVYCAGEAGPDLKCFLIDKNGIIFQAFQGLGDDFVIIRQGIEDGNLYAGKSILAKNIADTISKIQNNLKSNFQINLGKALVTSPLRLDVATSEGWNIYFSLGQSPNIDEQLLKLDLLLQGEITAEARKSLRYIDLRFSDRAYYK